MVTIRAAGDMAQTSEAADRATEYTDNNEIAVAAVREFCMRPRPQHEESIRLVDLILPLLPLIGDRSRRQISAALAVSEFAPKPLLLALCDFPTAICSPVLTRSPLLSDAELLAIVSQHGERHARSIARRPNLSAYVAGALRTLNSEAVDRSLDLRHRLDDPMPTEQARSFDRFEAALNGDIARQACTIVPVDIDEFVSLASDPNPALFRTAVADALGITLASATALCSNPTSRNLVYMLRFIDIPAPCALQVFAALAPELVRDIAVVRRFLAVFGEIAIEDAVRKVWSWRSDDLLALAREALAANDPNIPEEETGASIEPDDFMKVA